MKKEKYPMSRPAQYQSFGNFKKEWGQYELIDQHIVHNILDALSLKPEDTILEIGPGTGVLTLPIKDKVKRTIAIEIDKRFCDVLVNKGIEVINADFLRTDLSKLEIKHPFKIVSNLPYYITTPIITKILEEKVPFDNMVLMMQEEVANRLTAMPGVKAYGAISVLIHFYTIPELICRVPKHCFRPVPKVDSCVVRFKRRRKQKLNFPVDFLFRVVRCGFSTRRKMLKNTLKHFKNLDNVSLDLSRRAETLSVKEFCKLAEELWIRR